MEAVQTKDTCQLKKRLDPIVKRYQGKKGITIQLLTDLQQEIGYVSEEAVEYISKEMDIPPAELFGVATFYAQFHLQPRGRYIIRVCRGTACHVRGSLKILNKVMELTGIGENETSQDLKFTIEPVACLGACGLAPVMMVNDQTFGRLTPDKIKGVLEQFA